MFVVAFFIMGQIENNPDAHHKRVDKLAALYSYNRILFIDKNGDMQPDGWISKISCYVKEDKHKNILYDFIYMTF